MQHDPYEWFDPERGRQRYVNRPPAPKPQPFVTTNTWTAAFNNARDELLGTLKRGMAIDEARYILVREAGVQRLSHVQDETQLESLRKFFRSARKPQ